MRRSFFVAALLSSGCLSDAALDYDELYVSATLNGSPVTTSPQRACTALPLLLGSHVEETVTIVPPLRVKLSATRDRIRVDFSGAQNASALDRTYLEDDFDSSFAEELSVQSTSGETFLVTLSSSCPPRPDSGS